MRHKIRNPKIAYMSNLLKKYNIAAPRYTSYPTVPYWDHQLFSSQQWENKLFSAFQKDHEGISLYIHLPFCESLCTYCGCNTRITKNHNVELPYIQALIAEWQLYIEMLGKPPVVKELHLGGGTPTFFSAPHLELLIKSILGKNISTTICSFEAHPDNTTTAHLKTLGQLGFKRLSLGVQDFDPRVQFMINRFQTPQQVKGITQKARELGYTSINYDLIYGLPGQTSTGLTQTLYEVIGMMPDRIAFYSYAHVPWLKPGQRHYSEKDIPQGDEKFALYQLGRDLLLGAGYEEIGMDHFALRTDSLYQAKENYQLHRNFMGYTDNHTKISIGLGVSAISDCFTAFAQNSKTVEGYLAQIGNGNLAVDKGHILTDKDLQIRQHILNLMCKGSARYSTEIPQSVKERLALFLEDELIYADKNSINILSRGKPFLRNICMALDERMWLQKPETTLFSRAI